MIKTLLRLSIFSAISLKATQYVIGGYNFETAMSVILYVTGITLLYLLMKPLLALIAMPSEGPGFIFMSFLLTAILGYVFPLFIPGFNIQPTTISELIIFGVVLPSKSLNVVWSNIFSALLISVLMWFFRWLCYSDKK